MFKKRRPYGPMFSKAGMIVDLRLSREVWWELAIKAYRLGYLIQLERCG